MVLKTKISSIRIAIFALCFVPFALSGQCPFCKPAILEGQTVYEGDQLRILIDHAPIVPGHLLVIPKRHLAKAHEMSREE